MGKIPQRREWQPTPIFLPGEFHGQGSPVGFLGCKELDMLSNWYTHTSTYFILCCELNSSHLVPLCLSKHVSFSKHLSYLVRDLTEPARFNCWQESKDWPTPSHPPPLKMVLDQDMCMLSISPFINVFCNLEYVHKYKLSLLSLSVFS